MALVEYKDKTFLGSRFRPLSNERYSVDVIDCYTLEKGDSLIYRGKHNWIFTILEIEPIKKGVDRLIYSPA